MYKLNIILAKFAEQKHKTKNNLSLQEIYDHLKQAIRKYKSFV
jgi:hypothetical protein